jgi:hypothetical protein
MDKAPMCGSVVRQFLLFMAMAAMHVRLMGECSQSREIFITY